jgi:hypothetical protein
MIADVETRCRDGMSATIWVIPARRASNHTVRYATDFFFNGFPGNKLPGYDRLVPTGQNSGPNRHRIT